jgi:hypothetical protein
MLAGLRLRRAMGRWHFLATLARYCRVRSCLVTSRNHGIRPIDAIHAALTGHPGYQLQSAPDTAASVRLVAPAWHRDMVTAAS